MKNPETRKKLRTIFNIAILSGLIFGGIILAINLYILRHGAENGEQSWMATFLFFQAIPSGFLLHFASNTHVSTLTLFIMEAMADGLAMTLVFFTLGIVLLLIKKDDYEKKD
jgi:hypothetical protein